MSLEPPSGVVAKPRLAHDLLRVAMLSAFFAGAAFVLHLPVVREHLFDVPWLRAHLRSEEGFSGSPYRFFLVVAGGAVLVGLGFPRTWLAVVAGTLFGALEGSVLAYLGALLGSLMNYEIGRSVLSGVVKRRLEGVYNKWKGRVRRDAFWWVLFARLIPFMNGTLMNLIFGAMRTPIAAFLAASAIGFLPLTISFVLFGSGAAGKNHGQLLVAAIVFLLAQPLLILRLWPRLSRQRKVTE
ncbi:MAG: hypothetical protein PWP23_1381 [Candidatus Sumerlaeota bacterium]|nr:hypothetical protein [Candidatus Sumerlaeota bacterium]